MALRATRGGDNIPCVLAIHEATGKDITLSKTAYALVTGGGKPGQGYPCILIVKEVKNNIEK